MKPLTCFCTDVDDQIVMLHIWSFCLGFSFCPILCQDITTAEPISMKYVDTTVPACCGISAQSLEV